MWRPAGDEQLQEVIPAREGSGIKRVTVDTVGEREPLVAGAREVLGPNGAVGAGLLLGPLAGQVYGRLDLVHERNRRHRIGDRGHVELVGIDLADLVDRFAVEDLVGLTGLIAALDPLQRPRLA